MRYLLQTLREKTGRRLIAAACAHDPEGFRRAWSTWCRIWEIELFLNPTTRSAVRSHVPGRGSME